VALAATNTRFYTFAGGSTGTWSVRSQAAPIGGSLPPIERLEVIAGSRTTPDASWLLRGITSNDRYVQRREKDDLIAKQPELDRPDATFAALIAIRKTAAWWALTQDERREIFEEQSQHIRIGLEHLPAVARRLHHCRDVSETEPFDFLTWFEYAPTYEPRFESLLCDLRASAEWKYVGWEVDIRLSRTQPRRQLNR
jgi:hypothetical protein